MRRLLSVGRPSVRQLFSTDLYIGSSQQLSVTNDVNLAAFGGFVLIKQRDNIASWHLRDNERPLSRVLITNGTDAESNATGAITFGADGFTLQGNFGGANLPGVSHVAWTFRKARRFFDVVTYTGTGSEQTIAHDLGVAPGMIWVKQRDGISPWGVYHSSADSEQYLRLNLAQGSETQPTAWVAATQGAFTVGSIQDLNIAGGDFVAYLFAHNPHGVIYCGTYAPPTDGVATTVSLGWRPQFLIVKSLSNGPWGVFDAERGGSAQLRANESAAELTNPEFMQFTSDGFSMLPAENGFNAQGVTYLFMAIRSE